MPLSVVEQSGAGNGLTAAPLGCVSSEIVRFWMGSGSGTGSVLSSVDSRSVERRCEPRNVHAGVVTIATKILVGEFEAPACGTSPWLTGMKLV